MTTQRKAIEQAAADQLVAAVRAVREQHPGERIYGAMFHEFYGDGSVMSWPMVTVGTEESLRAVMQKYPGEDPGEILESLRWSGPDLPHGFEPSDDVRAIADAAHTAASSSGLFEEWQRAYNHFLRCFPRAAKEARKTLIAAEIVEKDFVAIAADESGELIPLSLTKPQLRRHFPQYEAAERERRRLAALSVTERVIEILPEAVTPQYQGPLIGEHEKLLVACGEQAVPALVSVIRGEDLPGGDAVAARLLAEINIDTPEVVEALVELMRREKADMSARSWAASALARLGRSDLILTRASKLPADIVASGISDPFSSFRDHGAHRALDYGPLERALEEHPHLEADFREYLRPGSAYCRMTADERPTAEAALTSRWDIVRNHARTVLKDAGALS